MGKQYSLCRAFQRECFFVYPVANLPLQNQNKDMLLSFIASLLTLSPQESAERI